MIYEIRRAGDGVFYLVTVDGDGNSTEMYNNGKLVRFGSSEDAKEYVRELKEDKPTKKRRII